MVASQPVAAAILADTSDPEVRAAMLLGASYEGGWGPTYGIGDSGHSFGPFQINLPYHPGVTPAMAQDPNFAVRYMLPAYTNAVHAQGALWQSNPELAAEQAAVAAENPAMSYLAKYGSGALDQHWSNTLANLKANGTVPTDWRIPIPIPGVPGIPIPHGIPNPLHSITDINTFFKELGGTVFNSSWWRRVGIFILGGAILIAGLIVFFKVDQRVNVATAAKVGEVMA